VGISKVWQVAAGSRLASFDLLLALNLGQPDKVSQNRGIKDKPGVQTGVQIKFQN
jgi:hypothetical protein